MSTTRTALVTGSTSGIGRGIAETPAATGMRVMLAAPPTWCLVTGAEVGALAVSLAHDTAVPVPSAAPRRRSMAAGPPDGNPLRTLPA